MAPSAAGAPRGAAEILDEAVRLVRRVGAVGLVTWCVGSVPFVLGFLFFFIEMRFGPFARDRLFVFSGVMAALYLWMKVWQSVFAMGLRRSVEDPSGSTPTTSDWSRVILVQARIQPTALLALPLSAISILGFGWVYAFYNSLSVTGDVRSARRCAVQWPMQNHAVIAMLLLCSIVVFVNIFSAIMLMPWLAQTLLGVSSQVSRNPWILFNSTTMMATGCLTYVALGPVVKAAYVLRCFDGESQTTGADLRLELAGITARSET
jgi:hypothetical protein